MTSTPEQTAKRVLELSEKATKGPWDFYDGWDTVFSKDTQEIVADLRDPKVSRLPNASNNGNLIKEYRTAAPELARAYLKLETELQQSQQRVSELEARANSLHSELRARKRKYGKICKLIGESGIPIKRRKMVTAAIRYLLDQNTALRNAADGMLEALEFTLSLSIAWSAHHGRAYNSGLTHPTHQRIIDQAKQAIITYRAAGEDPTNEPTESTAASAP